MSQGLKGNVMALRHRVLHGILVATLLGPVATQAMGAETTVLTKKTLTSIQNCVDNSSPPWPPAWRDEYVDTIRRGLTMDETPPDLALRLGILKEGFQLYWKGVRKSRNRVLFEVQCAEIRWYVESLMALDLPSEADREVLCRQWRDLWRSAAESLSTQFSFLDPNMVQEAQVDHLRACLSRIEAPLEPIYRQPLRAEQMDQIKRGWHDMRYARVDLMRQLGGEAVFLTDRRPVQSRSDHPDYLLAQRSLEKLLGYVWMVAARPPDYYRSALQNRSEAQERRRQLIFRDLAQERRLRRKRSTQVHQTEYLSFLLTVLLESPRCLQAPLANGVADQTQSATEQKPRKEGMPMR